METISPDLPHTMYRYHRINTTRPILGDAGDGMRPRFSMILVKKSSHEALKIVRGAFSCFPSGVTTWGTRSRRNDDGTHMHDR
jgi:hypothetical protein